MIIIPTEDNETPSETELKTTFRPILINTDRLAPAPTFIMKKKKRKKKKKRTRTRAQTDTETDDGRAEIYTTDRQEGRQQTDRPTETERGERQRQTDGDRQRQLDRIHTLSGLFTCFIVPVALPLTTGREGVTSSPSHKMTTTTPLNSLPNDLISNIGLE